MNLIKGKHISINTNSPYGSYHFFNVIGTDYYINTTIYQITKTESVHKFANCDGHTVTYTDEPYTDMSKYIHLIEYANRLHEKENKND